MIELPLELPLETSIAQVDESLVRLNQHKQDWLQVSHSARIQYLQQCLRAIAVIAEPWAETSCHIKGLDPQKEIAGEEWLAGPFAVMHYLRLLLWTLQTDEAGKTYRLPVGAKWTLDTQPSSEQQMVQVFPNTLFDRLLWLGVTAEVWSQPGQSLEFGLDQSNPKGEVALVLGAGNISSIGPLDVLHQLFVEHRVVILKMNPVQALIGPWLERAFAGLIADGFLAIAYGASELGAYLCEHPDIDAIHITGSQRTHDTIVWGSTTAEQTYRKLEHTPKLQKPITSELGGITPIIVVPGNWSKQDLAFQARHIASMVAHNASFNCVSGKLLVLSKHWPQRDLFLELIRQQFRQIPPRQAYYPGAQARYQRFLEHYPQAEILGAIAEGCIPWTLIPNVAPRLGEYALTEEAFCPILAETSLEASSPAFFLAQAVDCVNDCVYGTLSCTVLIAPQTRKCDREGFERAIADLRYGTIGVNIWSGALFAMPEIPWGAFPGNALDNIGSGEGLVHNTFLGQNSQKAVVYAPFRIWPTPLWFAEHRTLKQVAQQLVKFELQPSWPILFSIIAKALQG